jgi:hypothetical protein
MQFLVLSSSSCFFHRLYRTSFLYTRWSNRELLPQPRLRFAPRTPKDYVNVKFRAYRRVARSLVFALFAPLEAFRRLPG